MIALALLAVSHFQAHAFEFKLNPQTGLTISAGGFPIVQGSGCQIYAPGWTRGYYSTSYADQKLENPDADTAILTFANGPAKGKFVYHRDGAILHVDETYQWDGDDPALVEVTAAKFWAPALAATTFSANGKPMPSLATIADAKADMPARRLAPDGAEMSFAGPWGTMTVAPRGTPWFFFDARGFPQEYAVGRSLLWFGILGQPLPKGQSVHVGFDLTFNMKPSAAAAPVEQTLQSTNLPVAEAALDDKLPLAPFPKRSQLSSDGLELGGKYTFPTGEIFHFDDFTKGLANRFEMPTTPTDHPTLIVDGGIHDMHLPREAYQIEIRKDGLTVFGQDEAGYRHALRRLALLAYSSGGKAYLPLGTCTDWPSTPWRGVHMFVGPNAAPFQLQIMDRVLLPFGFNKAVLECERTAWTSIPNVRGADVMSPDALHQLFRLYKKEGLEAIPLLNCFGHMEWFFANKGNLDVAFNPAEPYGVDPRKPQTKELLTKLWDEVIQVTDATTIHFGCDEVDMIGWKPDPILMTDLWKLQMPILGDIAKAHNVQMMIWGDMALAPGEAIDATNGYDQTQADVRRRAIPKGTLIADWHYKADPKFEDFFPSLQLFKSAGLTPIASTWHEPDNVYGFSVAGVQQGGGTLKTTWSSSDSSAGDPIAHFEEYASMVLSGEYSWSGRQDPPSDLGYDYRELFRRIYFERPMPLAAHSGTGLSTGSGTGLTIGRYHFAPLAPISLFSALVGKPDPSVVTLKTGLTASTLVLACGCDMAGSSGDPVATVTVTLADGTSFDRVLNYGWDLRAGSDSGVVPLAESADGKYAALITLPKGRAKIASIRISAANTYSRFSVYGLTGI